MRPTRPLLLPLAAALCLWIVPSPGAAVTLWDEGVNGDLSDNRLAPTALGALAAGSSTLSATSVAGDREYYTLSVPAGYRLDAIVLSAYVTSSNALSFIGVQSGTTFTEPPTGTNVANLLGWTHYGPGFVGADILDDIGTGFGAQGFTPPLGAGAYTFWSQETGASPASYTFDFQVSLVPEPGTGSLLGLGLGGIAAARRRRSASAE